VYSLHVLCRKSTGCMLPVCRTRTSPPATPIHAPRTSPTPVRVALGGHEDVEQDSAPVRRLRAQKRDVPLRLVILRTSVCCPPTRPRSTARRTSLTRPRAARFPTYSRAGTRGLVPSRRSTRGPRPRVQPSGGCGAHASAGGRLGAHVGLRCEFGVRLVQSELRGHVLGAVLR
jgi:hypothetical protein